MQLTSLVIFSVLRAGAGKQEDKRSLVRASADVTEWVAGLHGDELGSLLSDFPSV